LRAVPPAAAEVVWVVSASPDDHFAASPYGRVRVSAGGCVRDTGAGPTVSAGVISPPGVQVVPPGIIKGATPNDHFIASPYRRMKASASGGVRSASGYPTIRAWIVSPASTQNVSTPDDHFTAGPDRRVRKSGGRRIIGGGRRPTVRAWIVSSASV